MRLWLLSKCYGSIIIIIKWYGIRCHYPKLHDKPFELESFLYSIRISDIFSFYDRIHDDGLLETLPADCIIIVCDTYPDVDFLSLESDITSESIYPLTCKLEPPSKIKNKSLVLLRYLRIFFIAIQCSLLKNVS